ncbi:ATP-binding protein [Bacteroides sp. 51]|uniref:ATP-binding protein n=1 Tax=Bacteroides sp. 51 TaxID=2302938 RepID=UPI0013D0BCA9|nr:ATP-binding protein [Bacteroides sp. 51]NDV83089.1 ATP-binding protein [Bacteroides sp. 51]
MKNQRTNLPEKTEIKKAVNDYCKEKGISKSDFAVKSEVSPATLSSLEKEKWFDLSDAMLLHIWNFVRQNDVDQLYQSNDFISVFNMCDKARKHCFMLGLVADTGMGKTTALTTYAKQRNVFYVRYSKSMNTNQFFANLLREMAIPFYGTLNEMISRVSDYLNRLDTPLVIIDESGKLTHSMILALHELRDNTKSNCGIVLAGMPYFKANMQKMATKEKEGYAEFLRRINIWHQFTGLQQSEVVEICKLHGITDKERLRKLKYVRRFGDLMNEIYLEKALNGEL